MILAILESALLAYVTRDYDTEVNPDAILFDTVMYGQSTNYSNLTGILSYWYIWDSYCAEFLSQRELYPCQCSGYGFYCMYWTHLYRTPSINVQCRSMPNKILALISGFQINAIIGIDRHWALIERVLSLRVDGLQAPFFSQRPVLLYMGCGAIFFASYLSCIVLWPRSY